MTTQWTFANPEETVVWRDLGNGTQESELASLLSEEELSAVLPYVPPVIVPQDISRRQFYQELAIEGLITEAEAMDAMKGITPPELEAAVKTLPEEQQFGASMMLAGQIFDRTDEAFLAVAAAMGMSQDEIDALFTAAAKL